MIRFCQYLSFISLLCIFNESSLASESTLACALNIERQSIKSLSEFDTNEEPLIGYHCEFKPKRSTYLGNWFPSLPQLSLSQSTRLITRNNEAPETDDYAKTGYIDVAIKRFGGGQLVLHGKLKEWQHTLTANTVIPFFSRKASDTQNAVNIQSNQKARLLYTEKAIGLSFVFPYQQHQAMTRLTLQQLIITQPIQANIAGFPDNSLYNSEVALTEIGVHSNAYHTGLNINWGMALASGKLTIDSPAIAKASESYNDIISVNGELELHYRYRINRHWLAFGQWQTHLRYWKQSKSDNPDYKLAEVHNIEQNFLLGIGLSF